MSGKIIYIADSSDPIVITQHTHNDGRSFDTFFAAYALTVELHNQVNPSNQRTLHLEDPTPVEPEAPQDQEAPPQGGGQ